MYPLRFPVDPVDCFRRSRFLSADDAADRSMGADSVTGDAGVWFFGGCLQGGQAKASYNRILYINGRNYMGYGLVFTGYKWPYNTWFFTGVKCHPTYRSYEPPFIFQVLRGPNLVGCFPTVRTVG